MNHAPGFYKYHIGDGWCWLSRSIDDEYGDYWHWSKQDQNWRGPAALRHCRMKSTDQTPDDQMIKQLLQAMAAAGYSTPDQPVEKRRDGMTLSEAFEGARCGKEFWNADDPGVRYRLVEGNRLIYRTVEPYIIPGSSGEASHISIPLAMSERWRVEMTQPTGRPEKHSH